MSSPSTTTAGGVCLGATSDARLVWPIWILFGAMMTTPAIGGAIAAERNPCGCYPGASGTCSCDRGARCGCPGECEPQGCEKRREKQFQKELRAETKKAEEADRRHSGSKVEEPSESAKPNRARSSAAGRRLTAAQAKQLVRLLDLYFSAHPDARAKTVEEIHSELSRSR